MAFEWGGGGGGGGCWLFPRNRGGKGPAARKSHTGFANVGESWRASASVARKKEKKKPIIFLFLALLLLIWRTNAPNVQAPGLTEEGGRERQFRLSEGSVQQPARSPQPPSVPGGLQRCFGFLLR